ncbi:MAG: galactofuranose transport system substrate-binding protein [Blastocatellia bacterium]|jgi:ribose transport system substrate-binding protein|nr:galactofuranose transport system substrate-binding protein [Blastocatellia bacterium]
MKSSIKHRKHIAVALIAVMALFILSAASCAKKSANGGGTGAGGKIVVGFSQMENNGPWRIAETNSMKEEARKRGDKFELVVTDAQGQTSKQVSDVEDLIARRVKAIFLAPREFEGLAPAIQAAKQAGIPIFLIDREAAGKAGEDYVTFIGSNFVEEGQRAGEWLAKQTNGKAGIVELTGTAGSSVANDRSQGFKDAIKDKPEMKIIASQTGDFTRATAQKVMENIIQSKGKEITVVYAHNDEMALGAIQALKDANMNPGKDVIVVSVDGEKAALQAIGQGTMNVSVECNPRFGPIAFDTLEKYLNGEKVSTKIIVPDRFFDQSNAQQFVNEAY